MRSARAVALAIALSLATAAPAFADLTGFIGATTTPANRQTRGFAVGLSLVIVGFEFEYSDTTDAPSALAPSLKSGSANGLLQTPVAFFGFQPYITAGADLYRETLGAHQDTSFGLNTGGGVKISLIGPLRLRVDYRVFKLGSNALYSPVQRVYAGLNLAF